MKQLLIGLVFAIVASCVSTPVMAATGLKIAPLEYRTVLKEGEVQRGFVDVSNPSSMAVVVDIQTQGFRQINDDGGLEFYEDRELTTAIKPERTTLELRPKQAIRLYFTVDGRLLPKGDSYAALFFTTDPATARSGIGQSVRVGTLLSIVNQTPGERRAEVTGAAIPFFQLSDTIQGSYRIKNTGKEGSGFYPRVEVSAWPSGESKSIDSSLVFAGRERQNDMSVNVGYGLHRVDVAFGDSKQSAWVLTLAPWMLVLGALIGCIVAAEIVLLRRRRAGRQHTGSKAASTS